MTKTIAEDIRTYPLQCGATLLVEPNPTVRSAGLTWLIPMGNAYDATDRIGISALLSDWVWRGAGELNTKEYSDALDRLGVQRSSGLETYHFRLSATLIGQRLKEALPPLVSLIRQPILGDDTFESVRDLCLQSLASLNDDPQSRAMIDLKDKSFPEPFNRSTFGDSEGLTTTTPTEARAHWNTHAIAAGSIIAVSGDVDGDAVVNQLNELLGDWAGEIADPSHAGPTDGGYFPTTEEASQCHIGIAYPAPREQDKCSMAQRIATQVLGGGVSSRLFTEVRERRSLCYSVYATYAAGRDRGVVMAYAGTTPERAQETLDVMLAEMNKMSDGVDADEFRRAVVGMKSRLVMHGESTSARASAIARELYLLGKPRTLQETADEVDAVTLDEVNAYLANANAGPFTIVTLGPDALTIPTL